MLALPLQGVRAAAPNPRAVNLALADLPAGFSLGSSTVQDNAAAAKADGETVAQEVKSGRLLGYEVEFHRPAKKGLVEVDSIVIAYDTAAHARAAYLQALKQENADTSLHTRPLVVTSVGAHHHAASFTQTIDGNKLYGSFVLFHRGNYAVAVLAGTASKSDATALSKLARIVDTRIQQAG
jgi:hypothetical protein